MTKSQAQSMGRLRRSDPALGCDLDAVVPSVTDVLARVQASGPGDAGRRGPRFSTPRRRRTFRLLAAVTVAAGLLLVSDVVGLPGSDGGASAFGVTSHPDGTVDVAIPETAMFDRAQLQAALVAAGVRTVVLVESPAGTCDQPSRDGDKSIGKVIDYHGPNGGLTIHPRKLPAGATLVLTLPFLGEDGPGSPARTLRAVVLRGPPPTCVAQQSFAVPAGSPFPNASGQPAASPAVPTPLPSVAIRDGFALQSFHGGAVLIMTLNQDARLHAAQLQDALSRAGVSAVVLVAGSQPGCPSLADGGVIPAGAFQPYDDRSTVIRPGLLPEGSTVVIALQPTAASPNYQPWQQMYVATGRPPSCLGSTASVSPS